MSGSGTKIIFEKELTNMSILKQIRHPNIIQLLAAYSYNGKYNLIFPRAHGGTLGGLLNGDDKIPPIRFDSTETMMVAVAGLTSAICAMHDLSFDSVTLMGCHRDLKPSNILIHESRLLLADFGLSRFKPSDESSRSDFQQGQGDYLAPECEDLDFQESQKRPIGRASDIWSLGCILLELLTYLLKGPDGVSQFRLKRRKRSGNIVTCRFYSGNNNPHGEVLAWQDILEGQLRNKDGRQPKSPRVLQRLSNLVRLMLATNPEDRPKAAEVETELRGLAICSVSQHIKEAFDRIISSLDYISYYPLQEMRRFESWLAICKVNCDSEDPDFTDAWLGGSFNEFETIIRRLYEFRDLLREVNALSQDQSKRNYHEGRLFGRLDMLNKTLVGILPAGKQMAVGDYYERMMLANPRSKYLDDLCEKVEELYGGDRLSRLAGIKLWHKQLEEQGTTAQHFSIIQRSDIHIEGQNDDLAKVTYQEKLALLEYKPLRRDMTQRSNLDILRERLRKMMELLQRASQSEFPVLNCLGVYHAPEELEIGLLYGFPHKPDSGTVFHDYTTLATVLDCYPEQNQWPLLGQKFKLAHTLANSLLGFLQTCWLHRNIKASNIAFFYDKKILWERPSIFFLGFAHSRLATDKQYSEGPPEDLVDNYYLDPNYVFSQRFMPYHDHYALGIVLLEIGFWKRLGDVCGNFLENGRLDHTKFRKHALEVLVPQMGIHMGETYRDVVRVCIDGNGPLREGFTEAEDNKAEVKEKRDLRQQEKFKDLVVDQLARLSV